MSGLRLKQHHDEYWFDGVLLRMKGPVDLVEFKLSTVERWKESELSGDEWRFSYHAEIRMDGELIQEGGWGIDPSVALQFSPKLFYNVGILPAKTVSCVLSYYNRGVLLHETSFKDALEAVLSLPSDHITVREDFRNDEMRKVLEKTRAELCSQPACSNKPVVTYRIIKHYGSRGEDLPRQPDKPSYRQFCKKHRERGDCGLEDSDRNYYPQQRFNGAGASAPG